MKDITRYSRWQILTLLGFFWFLFSVTVIVGCIIQQESLMDDYNDVVDRLNACEQPEKEPWYATDDKMKEFLGYFESERVDGLVVVEEERDESQEECPEEWCEPLTAEEFEALKEELQSPERALNGEEGSRDATTQ